MNYIEKICALAAKHRLGFTYNPGGGQFFNTEKGINIQISTMDDKEDYHRLLMALQNLDSEPKGSNNEDSQCDRLAVEPVPGTLIECRITRGRDETGDYVITHGTPAPAIEPTTVNELADLAHELRKTAEYLQGGCGWYRAIKALELAVNLIESGALQRFAPVPVSERPWEREGWCDAKGQCWMGDSGGIGFVPSWRLCKPSDSCLPWSLPHHALPVPTTRREENLE